MGSTFSRLSVRAKVFFVTVMVVVAVDLAAGLFLERQLRGSVETRIENELLRHAHSGRDLLEIMTPELEPSTIDPLADRLGKSTASRVTIIRADGWVVGDSERDLKQLEVLENHGDRPEVAQAWREGQGRAKRDSETLETELLYVAVPFHGRVKTQRGGTIRVAMRTQEVADAVASLRIVLIVAGLLAVVFAISVAAFISGRLAEQLRMVVEAARAVSRPARRNAGAQGPETSGEGAEAGATSTFTDLNTQGGSIARLTAELQHTVHALAVERDRFQIVLKSMDEGVLAIDVEHRVTAANPAAHRMLAVSGELAGRDLMEVTRMPEFRQIAIQALAGEVTSTEITLDSQPPRILLVRARPQMGRSEGQVDGVVVVLHDVTEVRKLETVRQDFVANVSHELRTPVSIIQAHTETLLDGAVDDVVQARRFLEPIGRSAERLGQLIADLLDISRIDRGKYEIDLCEIDLADVFSFVKESVSKTGAVAPQLILKSETTCRVLADRGALEQVLINLVENAFKYGPGEGQVELVACEQGDRVRIEVRDEGPGIAEEHRARVFERFYRVDPGRSRHMGGTGLGLAIVKNLTEAMGGEVGVELRQPRGSIFWLSLPAC